MMFTSNPMHKKKVVRSWARRRVAQAVMEDLRGRGFDDEGRRIDGGAIVGGEQVKGEGRCPDALIGTVDVEVMDQCVETKYAEVQRQAGLIVDEVLNICGRRLRNTRLRPQRTFHP